MSSHPSRRPLALLALIAALLLGASSPASAGDLEFDPFQENWARTDKAVADAIVSRTWMWGPQENAYTTRESYDESPDRERTVVYFDKSRMEVTDPYADRADPWFVTNGLLVVELMSGSMQVGNDEFIQRAPAWVNVAGDANDPHAPTYASFAALRGPAQAGGPHTVIARIDRWGNVAWDDALASYGAGVSWWAPETSHWVAEPFWEFMTQDGLIWRDGDWAVDSLFSDPFYATGYPITEAYWATVLLKGVPTDVLIQCFERRCLTWTPSNPAGWEVEAGNVGQHYYIWRYGKPPPKPVG